MRKTLFILLLFSMAWCSVKAVKSSYAILNKDTLRIGNSYMERCFLWNHGALKTIALTDKLHGTCMQARLIIAIPLLLVQLKVMQVMEKCHRNGFFLMVCNQVILK